MAIERVRTHVVLPRTLLKEIDEAAGSRSRSQYIAEALQEKLARDRQDDALRQTAGILDLADYPEWDTPEKISAWVRRSRSQDIASLRRKLGDWIDE